MNMMSCAKFQEIVKCTYNQSLSPHAIALTHSTSQPFIQQSSANHGYVSFALVMTNNEVQDTTLKTERLSNANTIKYRGCTHVL
jgi:hypothetical protein